MAAPNIVNVTTITGKTVYASPTDTNALVVINNAASSGKVFKVNSLYVANIDGTNACDVTINLYSQDDLGGTAYAICKTVSVLADSTLVVIDKESQIYLEEDKSIGIIAGAGSDLTAIASYEEIS